MTPPLRATGEPRSNVVRFLRPLPPDAAPCTATVDGPFLGTDADTLRCSDLAGHDGPHYFHVEWGDTATPRWLDTMPSRCDHRDDPTYDGRWCAICNPKLGGDRGASA